jgi:DNA primase
MSVTEEIKARLDVVNLISEYVPLKKAGRNYTAPCPFHNERTPSFVVFPDSQRWHCFGACGEGGDIFKFMMKRDGLDFASALRTLAVKAGVELKERTDEQINEDEHLDRLRGLLEETASFFHEKLRNAPEAAHARSYARKRGFTETTMLQFKMGYAPEDWQQALNHLTKLGYSEDLVIEAGVAIRNDNGRVYDRFRNRLVIPIRDGRGQAIGFGARALNPDDNPKYLNSPQTPLFDKGATLFGLDVARRAIREGETAVIVEGYMDTIQAHQAGFTNVVAQMGTALTDTQLKQLSKYARRLILALDPDVAGVKATMRGLNVARQSLDDSQVFFDPSAMMRNASKLDLEIMVVTLPEGQDPDDLIRENPQAWQNLIAAATPVVDYVIAAGTAHLTPSASLGEREIVARELLPILLATESNMQQHYNIQRLALKLRIDERTLIQWTMQHQKRTVKGIVTRAPKNNPQQQQAATIATAKGTTAPTTEQANSPLERYCLAALIVRSGLLSLANRKLREIVSGAPGARDALKSVSAEDFVRSDYRAIFTVLEEAFNQDDQEPKDFLEEHLPYELRNEVENLGVAQLTEFKQRLTPSLHAQLEAELEAARKKEGWMTSSPARIELEFVHRIFELRKQRLRRENQDLYFLIKDADSDQEMEYNRKVIANRLALQLIDQTINQIALSQRDPQAKV